MDIDTHCADLVRAADRDRHIAALFAPSAMRRHLLALAAFDIETARVGGMVSEPMAGEIRLQWWHDALHGDPAGHPVAVAVKQSIGECGLPLAAFDNLLAARRFDLYADPMASLNDLEGYLGDTVSGPMQLAAIILADGGDPGTAELAGNAGVAVGLARLLAGLARRHAHLPADLVARYEVDIESAFAGRPTAAFEALCNELRSTAALRLAAARRLSKTLPQGLLPAFLPAAVVGSQLARLAGRRFDPLATADVIGPLRRQWLIWRAARRGHL